MNTPRNIMLRLPGLWLLPLLLVGCTSTLEPVTKIGDLAPGEIMVVGRIELVPRLQPEEQQVSFLGDTDSIKNKVFVGVDRKFVLIDGENTDITSVESVIRATFGETFHVKKDREALHIPYVMFYSKYTVAGRLVTQHRVFFPARLQVDFQPGDRAVYIGTFRYHRNEYFDITKSELIDDFAKEEAAYRKKFGSKVPLVKRLPRPLDRKGNSVKAG